MTGILVGESGGRPIAAARVLACMRKVCLTGVTGGDGRFRFEVDAPVDLVIKTEEMPDASPPRGAAVLPLQLEAGKTVDVGSVIVPKLQAGTPFGPELRGEQTLDVGDGVFLTLDRAALKPAAGQAILKVAARRMPSAAWRRYPAISGETIVAVYALHPFAAASSAPIGVTLTSSVPAGTRVTLRTIDEIDGTYSDPVPARASGKLIATDLGGGITRLTYLVVSRAAR